MTDMQTRALDAYELALKKIGKLNGKAGSGTEANMAQAYQRCVTLGIKPQIKRKYR